MRVVYLQDAAGIVAGTEKNISNNVIVAQLVARGIVEAVDKDELNAFLEKSTGNYTAPEPPKKATKAELVAKCEELGIEVIKSWKVSDLEDAIAAFEAGQNATATEEGSDANTNSGESDPT